MKNADPFGLISGFGDSANSGRNSSCPKPDEDDNDDDDRACDDPNYKAAADEFCYQQCKPFIGDNSWGTNYRMCYKTCMKDLGCDTGTSPTW